jgi:hypothetical protein
MEIYFWITKVVRNNRYVRLIAAADRRPSTLYKWSVAESMRAAPDAKTAGAHAPVASGRRVW